MTGGSGRACSFNSYVQRWWNKENRAKQQQQRRWRPVQYTSRLCRTQAMSQNHPIYKSISIIAITEIIKPSYLSPYKPSSPMKSRRISNKPTYKLRLYMIQHNQSHVASPFTDSSQISHIHRSSHSYYKPSLNSGSKVVWHQHHT